MQSYFEQILTECWILFNFCTSIPLSHAIYETQSFWFPWKIKTGFHAWNQDGKYDSPGTFSI